MQRRQSYLPTSSLNIKVYFSTLLTVDMHRIDFFQGSKSQSGGIYWHALEHFSISSLEHSPLVIGKVERAGFQWLSSLGVRSPHCYQETSFTGASAAIHRTKDTAPAICLPALFLLCHHCLVFHFNIFISI